MLIFVFVCLLFPHTRLVSHFEKCFVCLSLCFVLFWEIRPSRRRGENTCPNRQRTTCAFPKEKQSAWTFEKNQIWFVFFPALNEPFSSLPGVWFTFPLFGCGYKWKEMITAWQSPGGAGACLPREVLLRDKNSATSRPHFCSQNSSHGSQVHSLQESSIQSKISEIPRISHLNELE